MTTINDKLFGSEQKKQLLALGCDETTQIEIVASSAHYGTKHVRINGKSHIIH